MGPGPPWKTQNGQDLLLHLLLLAAAEPPEAGVDHGLGLLAPQRQEEQEQRGQQEQGPWVEERPAGSGTGSGLWAPLPQMLPFYHTAKTRNSGEDAQIHGFLLS